LIIKLILVLLLGWTGFSLIKKFKASNSNRSYQKGAGQKMVACDVCDTHVPESDVIVKNGKNYCSKEHAE
jgi:uncharacterized protein